MKPGKVVTYRDPHGVEMGAVVVAVVGAGASGCKVLDVRVGGHAVGCGPDVGGDVVEAVSHVSDAADGEGAWTLDAPTVEPIPDEPPDADSLE